MKAFSATIHGRVQGVGFRYSACNEAQRLGLSGWVRNGWDENVEVWAEGTGAKLDVFLKWLRHGPPWAHVTAVDAAPETPEGLKRFSIRG